MVSSNESPYWSLHGLPWPSVESAGRRRRTIVLMKTPLSLPPIVIVTSWVSASRRVELRRHAGVLGGEVVLGLGRAAGHVGEAGAGRLGDDLG